MQRLFDYLKQKSRVRFHGLIELPFQSGKLGNVKVHNSLNNELPFEALALDNIFKQIEHWEISRFYGIIKVPFKHGKPGKPMECRVFKPEEL